MARVPRLIGPQVASTPEPSTLRPLEAYGVNQSGLRAIGGALDAIGQAMEREQVRADEIRVNEARVAYWREVDLGLADPKDGLLHRRGTAAVEGLDPLRDRLTRKASDIEMTLGNDRQKALFRASAAQEADRAYARGMAHVGAEQRRADQTTHEALVAKSLEAIATDPANAVGVQGQLAGLNRDIRLFAERNDLTPEVADRMVAETVSKARLAQVAALVDADPERASAIMAANASDLLVTTGDRERATKLVEQGAYSRKVNAEASRILSEAQGDEVKAEELVKGVGIDARDDVRKVVTRELGALATAKKSRQDRLYLDATNLVYAGQGRAAIDVVPPSTWSQLSLEQRNALDRLSQADPKHDDKAWWAFYTMTPTQRANLSTADFQVRYWSKFDGEHRGRAERMYEDSQAKGQQGFLGVPDRITNALVSMHLVTKPQTKDWTADDYRFATNFETEIDRRIREFGIDPKDANAVQGVIVQYGRELTPVEVRGPWYTNPAVLSVRDVEADDRGRVSVSYDRIPTAERDEIAQAMREAGTEATKRRIEDAYGAKVMRDQGRYEGIIRGNRE